MEQLWAPWRMELIRQTSQGCFFCDYVEQKQDQQNLILERSEDCFVIMNRFPYSNGHLMVVPYHHTGDIDQLSSKVLSSMMQYTVRWQTILKEAVKAQGFNIGINLGKVAGAGVDQHVHLHIVPRWLGDTNFMAVVDDTKVINQSLSELYEILYTKATELQKTVQ